MTILCLLLLEGRGSARGILRYSDGYQRFDDTWE